MSPLKLLAPCLASMLVAAAIFSAGAAASSPEFFVCERSPEGSYTNSKCSSGSSGEFERSALEEGAAVSFTLIAGAVTLKTGSTAVECTSEAGSGETNGPSAVAKVTLKLKGCHSGSITCTTAGAASGEVVTKSLKGKLVYLKKEKHAPVGILLEPETGTVVAEAKCSILTLSATGSLIGEVTPTEESWESGEILYKENAEKIHQQWTQVEEEGAAHELQAFGGAARVVLGERLTWAAGEQIGVAARVLNAPLRFVAAKGKAGYPLALKAMMTSPEEVYTLGVPANEIACKKNAFNAPTLKRSVLTVVLQPSLTECTLTYNGRADPNVKEKVCGPFEMFSGGLTTVASCTFIVEDIVDGAGKKCEITITAAIVNGKYASIKMPKEIEVTPSSKAVDPAFEYKANEICNLNGTTPASPAKGEAENHIKLVLSGTHGGVAEGVEVK